MTRGFIIISCFICFQIFANTNESVLSKGKWYKIKVANSGIYKLDYTFLKNIGLDIDNLDPKKLKVYGNGGGMLSQVNSDFRFDDLAENAIKIIGEEDGKFNGSDYVLFYAQGPNPWVVDQVSNMYIHSKNLYEDAAYYFITYSDSNGKRIEYKPSPANATVYETAFDERLFLEEDKYNLIKSGREWFGDELTSVNTRKYFFNLTGYVTGTPLKMKSGAAIIYGLANGQSAVINFQFKVNDQTIGNIGLLSTVACYNCNVGTSSASAFQMVPNLGDASNVPVEVSASSNLDPNGKSYLNYIVLNYRKSLVIRNGQTAFRTLSQTSDLNYKIENAKSNSEVWDVTSLTSPFIVAKNSNGDLGLLSSLNSKLHEYIAFNPDEVSLVPQYVGMVKNQNIHGLPTPDLLIVTHNSLLNQANELAEYRRSQGLKVEVVTVDQVYNEFSSGAQDITAIRDMGRMFYKRGGIQNMLLFGSCSYDYKDRIANNTNLVPCYQARNSFNTIDSYSSEDYFAFYGDNDGFWNETNSGDHIMYIGIGRIPVKSEEEAKNVVNKLKYYEQSNTLGKWRNRISFISDNGDSNIFLRDSEGMAARTANNSPLMNISKIYLDAYRDKSTPKGIETPGAAEAIRNTINQGALIMNYIGHGGTSGLTQEGVITIPILESWQNLNRLPFWVTATCDYSTYDDPSKVSSGVLMLTKSDGGGIGIISATRTVYSNTNAFLNAAFINNVFKRKPDGSMPTIGEICKNTKNQSLAGVNNRSYSLIGDPSMVLNYPKYNAFVSKINGKATDTVRALSEMEIEGYISSSLDTSILSDFNGEVVLEIYDKPDTFSTLGQQNSIVAKVTQQTSVFYSGKTEVKNGKFSTSFIVPKDINYRFGKGKISVYAFDKSQNIDASGFMNNFIVGGGATNAAKDSIPPEISLFLNDTTFKNGGLTNDTPVLLAKLYDESGINIARSGVGHEITAIIDEQSDNPIVLNDFYESLLNTYKRGKINFQLSKLEEGNHTLTLKAWDTHNNSAERNIDFIVSNTSQIKISQLFNYPNPATDHTNFQFIHNYAGQDIAIDIDIVDFSGKSVYKISDVLRNSSGTIDYQWDINATNNISAGSYVYRCKLSSLINNSQAIAVEKLVIIR